MTGDVAEAPGGSLSERLSVAPCTFHGSFSATTEARVEAPGLVAYLEGTARRELIVERVSPPQRMP